MAINYNTEVKKFKQFVGAKRGSKNYMPFLDVNNNGVVVVNDIIEYLKRQYDDKVTKPYLNAILLELNEKLDKVFKELSAIKTYISENVVDVSSEVLWTESSIKAIKLNAIDTNNKTVPSWNKSLTITGNNVTIKSNTNFVFGSAIVIVEITGDNPSIDITTGTITKNITL